MKMYISSVCYNVLLAILIIVNLTLRYIVLLKKNKKIPSYTSLFDISAIHDECMYMALPEINTGHIYQSLNVMYELYKLLMIVLSVELVRQQVKARCQQIVDDLIVTESCSQSG